MLKELVIVGGGPAGLRAAEVAALAGAKVTLYEGKPSIGRKFLVAGRGGLNLTHCEPLERFSSRYSGSAPEGFWTSLLEECDNQSLRSWASDLGVETFIGTSGRVFPKEFKAAPLLRRWRDRLRSLGVSFETCHKLQSLQRKDGRFLLGFQRDRETVSVATEAVILALGGASWPETGSDGVWISILKQQGIEIIPLAPANCGWELHWKSAILAESEGEPLKNITVTAGEKTISGELLITKYGLEGGALYQLGATLRSLPEPCLYLDLKPSFSAENLAQKLLTKSGDFVTDAIPVWRLGKAAASLLNHLSSPEARSTPLALAEFAKALPLPLSGPRPIAEAISSAGGVSFRELDNSLMIKRLPGLFVAGEMIDWEAPTGGYLLQGCFATGTRAGKGSFNYLKKQ